MFSRVLGGLVLVGLGYILVQLSQPYMHSYQFEQLVRQEINEPSHRAEASVVHKHVLEQARSMGFIVSAEDVEVERLVRGYQVTVHYSAPVDLLFYHAALDFNLKARSTDELRPE